MAVIPSETPRIPGGKPAGRYRLHPFHMMEVGDEMLIRGKFPALWKSVQSLRNYVRQSGRVLQWGHVAVGIRVYRRPDGERLPFNIRKLAASEAGKNAKYPFHTLVNKGDYFIHPYEVTSEMCNALYGFCRRHDVSLVITRKIPGSDDEPDGLVILRIS